MSALSTSSADDQGRPACALLVTYPVLARLLGTSTLLAAQATVEMLGRFAGDRETVIQTLLGGVDPGPVVDVEPGLGDRHQHGRSVTLVCFADSRVIIYKPRGITPHLRFGEAIGWLNERVPGAGLRHAKAVAGPGYGWVEFIEQRPLSKPLEARTFYFRQGMLLAALHVMRAADIHCQNIIASGDQPVLVDVETLFHPAQPGQPAAADPAALALAESVHRTALLPFPTFGENGISDQSGMGGGPGSLRPDSSLDWDRPASDQMRLVRLPAEISGARNRPTLAGQLIEPADHEAAVLDGFRRGYESIASDPAAFTAILNSCRDIDVRVILRPTCVYARLLDEATAPGLLHDADARERALLQLCANTPPQPAWPGLVAHEVADLWPGDVPVITTQPATRDLWTGDGHHLRDVLDQPGLSAALDAVRAMGSVDRSEQEWLISASLATRRPAGDHRSAEPMPQMAAAAAEPSRLLAVACGLADQIVARGKTGPDSPGGRRVNWLGLQPLDNTRWLVLPMGAGLSHGYLGVALFLAQMAALTRIDRYAHEARNAVSHMPKMWEILVGRPEYLAAVGCGGMDGLGGISYGLARMASLLDEPELASWAEQTAELAVSAAEVCARPGWTDGWAGCLAALTAVECELGRERTGQAVQVCADRLADLVERTAGRCAPPDEAAPGGFAAGSAGIGWALLRFGRATVQPRYARAGERAVRWAGERIADGSAPRSYGWCRGLAGVLTAHALLSGEPVADQAERAALALTSRPVLRDLSLCHGELGIAEALTVLASADQGSAAARARRQRAGLILDALNRHDRYCGTPGGTWTPGLLNGIAGIGYGLLRMGFPERVPSVLMLEPALPSLDAISLPLPAGDQDEVAQKG